MGSATARDVTQVRENTEVDGPSQQPGLDTVVHPSRRQCIRDSCRLLLLAKFGPGAEQLWTRQLSQLQMDEVALEGISMAASLEDVTALFFDR